VSLADGCLSVSGNGAGKPRPYLQGFELLWQWGGVSPPKRAGIRAVVAMGRGNPAPTCRDSGCCGNGAGKPRPNVQGFAPLWQWGGETPPLPAGIRAVVDEAASRAG